MRNKYAYVSDPNDFKTCPGSPIHVLYSPRLASDGSLELVASGKENIQDKIESFREQTDFAYILKRLELGDTSVVNVGVPMFGDFTQMPKTMAEAMQLQIDAEKEFNKLPLAVRNSFDHDFKRWLATAGSSDWIDKMRPVFPEEMRSINNNVSQDTGAAKEHVAESAPSEA